MMERKRSICNSNICSECITGKPAGCNVGWCLSDCYCKTKSSVLENDDSSNRNYFASKRLHLKN